MMCTINEQVSIFYVVAGHAGVVGVQAKAFK